MPTTLQAESESGVPGRRKEQFASLEQQRHADRLGMWTFLATEVLFFGVLFLAYTVYRIAYPAAFDEAAEETNWVLGTLNTAVLLTSSLSMALAVHQAKLDRSLKSCIALLTTAALGTLFLLIKAYEYHEDFGKHLLPGSPEFPLKGTDEFAKRCFYWLYYGMTGLHALHLTIAIVPVGFLALRALLGRRQAATVEVIGLYWHFVDAVWVFLYPLLYLVHRHS